MAMQIICAWCKEKMGEKEGEDLITHAICPSCFKKVQAEIDESNKIEGGDYAESTSR